MCAILLDQMHLPRHFSGFNANVGWQCNIHIDFPHKGANSVTNNEVSCGSMAHNSWKSIVLLLIRISVFCNTKCLFLYIFKLKQDVHEQDTALNIWARFQHPIRRVIVRSRKVSKPRDWPFELSYRFVIWQALRQQYCRYACKISERSDYIWYKSPAFDSSRYLTIRRLIGY